MRVLLFIALCAVATTGLLFYVRHAARRTQPAADSVLSTTDPAQLARIRSQPHVVFINTTFDEGNSRIALAPLGAVETPRYVTPLACVRAHVAGRRGLCLNAERGVLTRYYGYVFDEGFRELARFPLKGTPSRARVSPDGLFGATTVFVSGDSYAANSFSTRTAIVDMRDGHIIGDLEEFTVFSDGRPFRRADFNFWGVTFGADGVFYATLSTAGQMLLVRGTAPRREVAVLHQGVECPSLSPDATRIGFKKRSMQGGRVTWRLHVLDLRTQADIAVSEARSVDDQVAWLDDAHLLYALPREAPAIGGSDIWSARADGGGSPALFRTQAYSPSIVH